MPNWCFTQMIFHGEKEEINDFHNKIEEWTSKNFQNSDFGHTWLGNVLHGAGLGHRIDSDTDSLRCRGAITYLGEIDTFTGSNDTTFNLDTETAWSPMCLMWEEIINTLNYKTIGFSYCAEEPGFMVYEICDPYGDFPERYYVDIFVDGDDDQNEGLMELLDERVYCDDDELKSALQEFLKTEECDLKTLINDAKNYKFKSEHTYLRVNKYHIVDTITD